MSEERERELTCNMHVKEMTSSMSEVASMRSLTFTRPHRTYKLNVLYISDQLSEMKSHATASFISRLLHSVV